MAVAPDVVSEVDDVAASSKRAANFGKHDRPIGLPAMLLIAHPLQPYGPSGKSHGEERGAGACIVGAIVAVTARALDVNAAHFFLRHAQQFSDRCL